MQKQRTKYETQIQELSKKFSEISKKAANQGQPNSPLPPNHLETPQNGIKPPTNPSQSHPSIAVTTAETSNSAHSLHSPGPTSSTSLNEEGRVPTNEEIFESFIQKMQEEQTLKEKEFEQKRQQILNMEKKLKRRETLKRRLKKKLIDLNIMIDESNLIGLELKRQVKFYPDLAPCYFDDNFIHDVFEFVKIKVENYEKNQVYVWNYDKFTDRYYLFKEKLQAFFEETPSDDLIDPFWDPNEHIDIARFFVVMKPLVYMFDNEITANIYYESFCVGKVNVRIEPCKVSGEFVGSGEVEDFVDPNTLLDKPFYFNVYLGEAQIAPIFTQSCFVQYSIKDGKSKDRYYYKTRTVESEDGNLNFGYKMTHCIEKLNQSILVYMTVARVRNESNCLLEPQLSHLMLIYSDGCATITFCVSFLLFFLNLIF